MMKTNLGASVDARVDIRSDATVDARADVVFCIAGGAA